MTRNGILLGLALLCSGVAGPSVRAADAEPLLCGVGRPGSAKRDAKRKLIAVDRFFRANPYGVLSLETKLTRTHVLPRTNAECTAMGLTPIRDDARAAALADGHD